MQITSFSDTFGVPADQVNVTIHNFGSAAYPFYSMEIYAQSGVFQAYNSTLTGTISIQAALFFPQSPAGYGYSMSFDAVDGGSILVGDSFHDSPGGTVTESMTASTLLAIPATIGPNTVATFQGEGSAGYSSAFGDSLYTYDRITYVPEGFEFMQPELQPIPPPATPEPAALGLVTVGLAACVACWRRTQR